MKNYDFILILVCLFLFRIILLSGQYSDAICLTAVLAYRIADNYLKEKKLSSQLEEKVLKNQKEVQDQLQVLANEVVKVKNSAEGLKAAVTFARKDK